MATRNALLALRSAGASTVGTVLDNSVVPVVASGLHDVLRKKVYSQE